MGHFVPSTSMFCQLQQHFCSLLLLSVNTFTVILGGVIVIMLVIGPKVCGFKPGQEQWILRVIKILSTTSFGGEVKLCAPCRKFFSLKIPWGMIGTDRQISVAISCPVSPHIATRCLLQPEQRTLVEELEMLRTQMGSTVYQKSHCYMGPLYCTTQ
jgi:hypothetical protein